MEKKLKVLIADNSNQFATPVWLPMLLDCPEGRSILSSSALSADLPAEINAYTLQRTIPSVRDGVTTASPRHS